MAEKARPATAARAKQKKKIEFFCVYKTSLASGCKIRLFLYVLKCIMSDEYVAHGKRKPAKLCSIILWRVARQPEYHRQAAAAAAHQTSPLPQPQYKTDYNHTIHWRCKSIFG